MPTAWFAVLCATLLSGVLAKNGFVEPPTGFTTKAGHANTTVRYKSVPAGICETNPSVKSYSGYVDTAENEHMFFWFFEARKHPENAPLTIWFNGGPGSSSMIGLFQENGPCRVSRHGNVVNNPQSWSEVSNMIFIDQPVTTGLSYSAVGPVVFNNITGKVVRKLSKDECPDDLGKHEQCGTFSLPDDTDAPGTTAATAPAMWKVMQGFLGAFPEYAKRPLHITTESYGGHYAPMFANYFLEQNKKNEAGSIPLHLDTVMIGNGWYDPIIQMQAFYNYTVWPGNTYDLSPYNKSVQDKLYHNLYGQGQCIDQLKECYATKDDKICRKTDAFCYLKVEALLGLYAHRDEYDVRELSSDPFPYENYVAYMNTEKVQKSIGAFQNYSESSAIVAGSFMRTGDDSLRSGAVKHLRTVLGEGVKVALYAGDADYNCNWLGGEVIAAMVGGPNFTKVGYTDMKTSGRETPGQVKQAGNFSFTRIYYSGHEVPFYQPVAALELLNRSLHHMDLATGRTAITDAYKTSGPRTSTFRQGNSTVQYKSLAPDATYNPITHKPNPRA